MIVTTTTFYADPDGKDAVRFSLACELVRLAKQNGHTVVIVDGSPSAKVGVELIRLGADVFLQLEKGIGPSRRQVWKEASNFVTPDTADILWTEPEKTDIICSIPKMLNCMRERKAQIVIPSRSAASWDTYPAFQRESEQIANVVYNNLFPSSEDVFDPMFGPVCFDPKMLDWFSNFYPLPFNLPDTYIQHYVPILVGKDSLSKVASVEVDFVYPPEQRAEEEDAKATEMITKRLWQLNQLIAAYLTMYKKFGFSIEN